MSRCSSALGNAATTSSERRYPWSLPLSIRFVTIASVTISRRRAASTRCGWAWGERQIKTHRSKAEGGADWLWVAGDQCGLALSAHSAAIARTNPANGLVYTRSLAELCLYFKRVTKKSTADDEQRPGYTAALR